MDDDPRFPPRLVCAALDIPHGTLGTWAARGYMANFDAAFAKQGKARLFTLKDGLGLALLRAADGGDPLELSGYAHEAADMWLKHRGHIRELKILRSATATHIRFNDDVMREPAPADWTAGWSYNLDAIFGRAETALMAALGQESVAASFRQMDETAPLFDTVSRVRLP